MQNRSNVLIVGGGIWGLSTAWHLAKRGVSEICVVERNTEVALETTPRAAGLVGQLSSSRTMCEAIQYALTLLAGFHDETGHDVGLTRTGSLFVALTKRRMEAYEQQVARAKENGVAAEFVSHAEMQRLVPAMNVSHLEGGYFVQGDGYLDPRRCALAYAAAAQDLGVQLRFTTRVTELLIESGTIHGVQTDQGPLRADRVVLTAGPWSGQLAVHAGFGLPMQTLRHQRACTGPIDGVPDHHPVVRVTDVSCYVRPEQGGYLFGFFEPTPTSIDLTAEPADFCTDDLPVPHETISEARQRLAPVLPILGTIPVIENHQGITSFAPDGRYLIGPVPGVDGLFVASGCAALGIAGSAAVGSWLAESVVTGNTASALAEFDPLRFGARAADRAWVTQASCKYYANYYGLTPGKSD